MTKLVIIKLITFYSLIHGVDPKISISVVAVESSFNINAIGTTNDLGLFQLNPKSFPEYTKKQLLDPILNIQLGVKYLAKMKKECKYKDDNTWLICWNAGKNYKKPINHPKLFPYIKKINTVMKGN